MQTYKLSPAFLSQAKRQFILLNVSIGSALYIRFVRAFLNHASDRFSNDEFIGVVILLIFIYVFCTTGIIHGNFKAFHDSWKGYALKIDNDSIIEVQNRWKDLRILKSDISKIYESPKLGLIIQGTSTRQTISIPHTLEEFEVVREMLAELHPIENVSKLKRWRNNLMGWAKAYITLLIIGWTARAVGLEIFVFPALLIGGVISIWKHQRLDEKTKIQILFIFGLFLFSLVLSIILQILSLSQG